MGAGKKSKLVQIIGTKNVVSLQNCAEKWHEGEKKEPQAILEM